MPLDGVRCVGVGLCRSCEGGWNAGVDGLSFVGFDSRGRPVEELGVSFVVPLLWTFLEERLLRELVVSSLLPCGTSSTSVSGPGVELV